ncbi:MAG TPA: hypothetical protein VK646_05580 [Actinomycetota bacterium]|nr:hypothetical protein [Actinomycetota bacterium]
MRRLFWLAVGVGFGAVSAVMASRWTRKQVERAKPQAIAREARGGLMDLTRLFTESVEEGRRAMDQRERELREKHDVTGPGAA